MPRLLPELSRAWNPKERLYGIPFGGGAKRGGGLLQLPGPPKDRFLDFALDPAKKQYKARKEESVFWGSRWSFGFLKGGFLG